MTPVGVEPVEAERHFPYDAYARAQENLSERGSSGSTASTPWTLCALRRPGLPAFGEPLA